MPFVDRHPEPAALPRPIRTLALGRLLAGVFALSTGYGLVLLLPLYVQQLGGSEATFGVVTACAAVPAALLLGLLLRFPDRLPASGLLAAAS